MKPVLPRVALLVWCLVLSSPLAEAANPIDVPMTAARWHALDDKTELEFSRPEGFPLGLLALKGGDVALDGLSFGNGTIAFDVKNIDDGIPGIRFRQRDAETAEEFYLRPGPDCAARQDCIQYTPVIRGVFAWDLFPNYQRPAPVPENGWSHIRLVVSGKRMNVFVNDAVTPTLAVDELQSGALRGGLQLRGPASFANVTVTPDAVEGLSPQPLADPTATDGRYLRDWQVSTASPLANDAAPTLAHLPAATAVWQPLAAERHGLVNLSRRFGSPTDKTEGAVAWLKTRLRSDRRQTKHVAIAWAREVWVFVNGQPAFADKNLYFPPEARKDPDGRLSLENGSFDLALQPGDNEIVVALSNNFPDGLRHYGWGLQLRLDDLSGISLIR